MTLAVIHEECERLLAKIRTQAVDVTGWEIQELIDALVRARGSLEAPTCSLFFRPMGAAWPEIRLAATAVIEDALDQVHDVLVERFGAASLEHLYRRARGAKLALDRDPGAPVKAPFAIVPDARITAAIEALRAHPGLAFADPPPNVVGIFERALDRGVAIPTSLATLYLATDGIRAGARVLVLPLGELLRTLDEHAPPEVWLGERVNGAALYFDRASGAVFDEDDTYCVDSLAEHLEQLSASVASR